MPKIVDVDEQRAGIAAQAAIWIARNGIETLSLRNVAAAHGCSKGMVQHYFTDKEELLFGALLWVTEQYAARERAVVEGLEGLAKVEARLVAILPLTPAMREEWVVRMAFYVRAALNPRMQEYIARHVGIAVREAVGDLRQAQAAGAVRTGINLTQFYRGIIATVAGIAISEIVSPNLLSPASQKQMLKNAMRILS
ncbi:hypothetical protein ACFB49_38170 [Sphingomonas sp. DBB INV C78]|uniref:TetR/AcrR family transcriptional regulator n=1 Tax=Sphingomonas sp. DBB INV C78 TaxID=3349434 RepID=UPI0036D34DB2